MRALLYAIVFVLISGCDDSSQTNGKALNQENYKGAGVYNMFKAIDSTGPQMRVFYYVPEKAHSLSPVLMVFHGNGRDAEYSRNQLMSIANKKSIILVVPEFSDALFPGSNEYQLGGMFEDGEDAKLAELRSEEKWAFALIDRIFNHFTQSISSEVKYYDVFGHSAGAQFVHRFVMFVPQSKIRKAVSAASGWYTLPTETRDFPYGLGQTNLKEIRLDDVFSKSMLISVGSKDTDPKSSALRHTALADEQGNNRVERAQFFYQSCQQVASKNQFQLNWSFHLNAGVEHDFYGNALAGIAWLYP